MVAETDEEMHKVILPAEEKEREEESIDGNGNEGLRKGGDVCTADAKAVFATEKGAFEHVPAGKARGRD